MSASGVAIIGLAGRFPGAASVEELWRNLCRGVESVRFLERAEVLSRGVDPALADDPAFVPAEALPDGVELFDAAFFDMSHREAEITDPQHRLLLECACHALEDAGYDPTRAPGPVGIFAGATLNTYLPLHLMSDPGLLASLDPMQVNVASAADFLTTRISYKLNLQGPSLGVQSACSTSLVAVALACQKLLDQECDLALAGGVSLNASLRGGYRYVVGGVMSPDGHCRPFDARARGTVFGGGVGLVVLKRLEEALTDGDTVRAVIRGAAVNNDGWRKVGYTAPSVEGQASVVAEALANAGISPATVGYLEAHGTATPLGDPVEVEALTRAFRAATERRGFCALGSIKGNVGHLDAAGGVTGLIKAALCLEREAIPPVCGFRSPNPEIDLAGSPFHVNTELVEWPRGSEPRRAGVSSFGAGGTNAHLVLEEAPAAAPGGASRPWQLLVLSARTASSLTAATEALACCLESAPHLDGPGLADAAFTLQLGRRAFEQRRAVVCRGREPASAALRQPHRWRDGAPIKGGPALAFLFPGQGAQAAGVAAGLYAEEPVFRSEVDRCVEIVAPDRGEELRALWRDGLETERLLRTDWVQPALLIVELALAHLLASWGIRPAALAGHSLGEYAAACLAGVFSREDALRLVAARGRLMRELPAGAMLAVPLAEEELEPWLAAGSGLALAAVNGRGRCVAAGPLEAVEELERRLAGEGVSGRRLATSHAFHSPALDPLVERFIGLVAAVEMRPPEIPFLSNVTGTWIRAEEAVDPRYWGRQMRRTVRFADNLDELLRDPRHLLLEVGPGKTLSLLARRHPGADPGRVVAALDGAAGTAEPAALLDAAGKLWTRGVEVDWRGLHAGGRRRRVSLPGYVFDRGRYWIERRPPAAGVAPGRPAEEAPAAAEGAAAVRPALHPRPELETVYVAPGSSLERRIAEVWQQCLGVDRVGMLDSFFALGGDSLLAVQTIDRLRRDLGREIPATDVYEGITVRDLARLLEPAAAAAPGDGNRQLRMLSRRSLQREMRVRRRQEEVR